jgi:DNA-binding CsgD family transcriptional regulator
MILRSVGAGLLTDDAIRVFGLIAAGALPSDEDTEFVAELIDSGYVSVDPERGNRPVALEPGRISQRRMEKELEEAEARVRRMRNLPGQTEKMQALFERAQWRTGGGSEFLDSPDVVNARLDDLINSARVEILAAQPGGPRTREQLERSVDRDRASLDRGVRMYTLYRDSARQSTAMAAHIKMMTGHGAEYRTLIPPYERAIVIDRKHAFVSDYTEDAPTHAAWHVTDRASIGFIVGAFMNAWQLATPWEGEPRSGPARSVGADGRDMPVRGGHPDVDTVSRPDARLRTTPLERAILRDLVDGYQQSTIATRLGISLRTLTDHLSVLKGKFGAQSLAQLACKFALSADYRFDDSALLSNGSASRQPVA